MLKLNILNKKLLLIGKYILLLSAFGFFCRDYSFAQTNADKTSIFLHFNHFVDSAPLILEDSLHLYHNANGDDYYVTLFKFYISQIRLQNIDGKYIDLQMAPILINVRDSNSLTYSLTNIPVGTYKNISFLIGVDSAINYDEVQEGALDPANGMYWNWKSGYVFLKMEGVSSASKNAAGRLFFHIGGILAPFNTLRDFQYQFEKPIKVLTTNSNNLWINANINGLFYGKKLIDFSKLSATMDGGDAAMEIADNYGKNLFTVEFSN